MEGGRGGREAKTGTINKQFIAERHMHVVLNNGIKAVTCHSR